MKYPFVLIFSAALLTIGCGSDPSDSESMADVNDMQVDEANAPDQQNDVDDTDSVDDTSDASDAIDTGGDVSDTDADITDAVDDADAEDMEPPTAMAFCDLVGDSVTYCNDMSATEPPEADDTLLIYDEFSGGLQVTSHIAQGYSNPRISGSTGALRFTMSDGPENDSGIQCPMPDGAGLSPAISVGFMMRLGPDFLAAHQDGGKFVLFEAESNGTGNRPMLALIPVTDTDGRVGPAGGRYHVFVAATDAAGLTSDEFGGEYPQDVYASGMTHTFRLEDYIDQWIYVEWIAEVGGTNRVYVATPDGQFDGSSPLAEVASTTEMSVLPWQYARINAYTELMSGSSSKTWLEVDTVRISDSHMGPPPGFFP